MGSYQNILLALDLSDEADQVLVRSGQLFSQEAARLTLLHVVEPVVTENSYDLITTLPADFEESLYKQAESFLQQKRDDFHLNNASVRVEIGSVKSEILRVAEQIKADLILVGTHGRHGVGLLLGSTANSVLHGTPCDILAVRIHSAESA
ncbi:universal stress protein [Thiohalophilus sp.]|uniref:universal stress protein n=1 Tax=Thiohalophilus sp. TaxID=3028392 RepID=UPI003975C540